MTQKLTERTRYKCAMCKFRTRRKVERPEQCPRCKRDNTIQTDYPSIVLGTFGGP